MKLYTLTPLGRRLARNTNNPDTPGWKIVHWLDSVGYQTPEQIADGTGLSGSDTSSWLGQLRRAKPPIVSEASEAIKGGGIRQ